MQHNLCARLFCYQYQKSKKEITANFAHIFHVWRGKIIRKIHLVTQLTKHAALIMLTMWCSQWNKLSSSQHTMLAGINNNNFKQQLCVIPHPFKTKKKLRKWSFFIHTILPLIGFRYVCPVVFPRLVKNSNNLFSNWTGGRSLVLMVMS